MENTLKDPEKAIDTGEKQGLPSCYDEYFENLNKDLEKQEAMQKDLNRSALENPIIKLQERVDILTKQNEYLFNEIVLLRSQKYIQYIIPIIQEDFNEVSIRNKFGFKTT